MTPEKMLASKSKIDANGCWLWLGYITPSGYGRIAFNKKTWGAHRLSYAIFRGTLRSGLEIDHLCRVRHCVNPAHLEQVTKAENIRRGISPTAINLTKTACPLGHEYSESNTMIRRGSKDNTWRGCRECHNTKRKTRTKTNYARIKDTEAGAEVRRKWGISGRRRYHARKAADAAEDVECT